MKKLGSLVALLLAFLLLIGSYVYIKNRPKKDQAKTETTSAQEEISKLDKDKIVKMSLKSAKGELVFERKDKDSEWKVQGVNSKLDQTAVNDIADSFANMTAEKKVEENPSDLDKYGLKTPAVTAKATLSDGTEKVLYLGDKAPVGTYYYLMAKDVNKVYAVWINHGEHFSTTLDSLRDKQMATIDASKLNYFKVVPAKGRTIEIKPNDEADASKDYGINVFNLVGTYSKPTAVDTQKLQDITANLANIKIVDVVEDEAKDLAKYGLDKPSLEIQAKDTDKAEFHILVGKDKDENFAYFKTADSKSVYTLDKTTISSFTNIDPFTLISKFACIINIDDVDKIVVSDNKGKTTTMTFSRETKKAAKEGEKDEVVTTYKVEGKEIKEEDYKKFYQTLIGLLVDSENDKKLENKPEVTTTYYLNKGTQREVRVDYSTYNENFYAVFRDGKSEFVIAKDKVNKMLTDLENLK